MAAPLAGLADLEAAVGHPVDPVSGDAALVSASGLVRAWCGWSISLETGVTFTVDGSGTCAVGLPTLHLVDVIEVRLDGALLTWSSTAMDGYDWSHHGHLYRWCGWPRQPRGVQATVDHGYDPVPDAVRAVVVGMAARTVEVPVGVRQDAVGTVIRQYGDPYGASAGSSAGDQLNPLSAAVLGPFRLPMQP